MNLEKCDRCGKRNIMCWNCEKNSNYQESTWSHDALVKRDAIREFSERLKDSLIHNYRHLLKTDADDFEWLTTDAVNTHIDNVVEQMIADMKKG